MGKPMLFDEDAVIVILTMEGYSNKVIADAIHAFEMEELNMNDWGMPYFNRDIERIRWYIADMTQVSKAIFIMR